MTDKVNKINYYQEIIDSLKESDLKFYPYLSIKKGLLELEKFTIVITTLHKGKKIIRGRLNEPEEEFNNVLKLSYKPQEFNKTYQRASTPFSTMFYGSVVPEEVGVDENTTERITVFGELAHSNEFLSDNNSVGEKKITFSRWDVMEDIQLVSIIHHTAFNRPPKIIKVLQDQFEKSFSTEEESEISKLITSFLAKEFAKEIPKDGEDFHYIISAIFSELCCNKYEGVLYPSIRLEGDGINVAIKPNGVEKLKFVESTECTIYKKGERIIIGTDTRSIQKEKGQLIYENAQNIHPDYFRNRLGLFKK